MTDTVDILAIELEQQKLTNAKLTDLLLIVQRTLPDPDGRVGSMIDEVRRTKRLLDDAGKMLDEKRNR